jgi:hypothetical protein
LSSAAIGKDEPLDYNYIDAGACLINERDHVLEKRIEVAGPDAFLSGREGYGFRSRHTKKCAGEMRREVGVVLGPGDRLGKCNPDAVALQRLHQPERH